MKRQAAHPSEILNPVRSVFTGKTDSMNKKRLQLLSAALALTSAGSGILTHAGEVLYDFNTDPSAAFQLFGNATPEWRADGGVNNSGYFKITDPVNSLSGVVILPDIDNGKVIQAFDFSVDIRVGDGTANPADGFSINYARAGDPVITTGQGFISGAAEEGTTTGLAIGFDTYDNGGGDVVGIGVKVDGTTVFSKAYPTRNGAIGDKTSLQTGPQGAGDFTSLAWEPFTVSLKTNGTLTITYKNDIVCSNLQTAFFPSAGRLVFAARTGGENEAHHIDNLHLKTIAATSPTVGVITGEACGFQLPIDDTGTISPRTNTLQVKLNGTNVSPVITRTGGETVVSYMSAGAFFPVGSTQQVTLGFTDSNGTAVTADRSWVVAPYTLITPAWKTANFTATSSGFTARVTQIGGARGPGDANSIANAEAQLAGGIIDPNTQQAYPNIADLSQAQNGVFTLPVINLSQDANGADPLTSDIGNFRSLDDASASRPDQPLPGLADPLQNDNIAVEFLTYLNLKRGCYTLGVNSDDGFLATLGHSPLGPELGSFNGGRGSADTLFRIAVEQDGVYPIRLSWWEGNGGANVEFFSVDAFTGKKTLINDPNAPDSIKAYSVGKTDAYIASILPARGAVGVGQKPTIKVVFQDDLTPVSDNSVQVFLDGQKLASTFANSGATTTVTAPVTTNLELRSKHTGQVVYSVGTQTFTNNFNFEVQALGFAIEAEDFDFDGGQFVDAANKMPYSGALYAGLGAIHDVDYHQPYDEQSDGSLNYRDGETPNVPIGGDNDAVDLDRPGFTLDNGSNYKIGWAGGDWYNYTRVLTNGNYKIIASQSHGDPAGTADRLVATYSIVTSGRGTPNQTLVRIGSYSEPATGGWGNNAIATVKDGGKDAVVHLSGTNTIRAAVESGDFDWFALIPTSERTGLPFVNSVTPNTPQRSITNLSLDLSQQFRDTTIDRSSVRLLVDNQDVTASTQVSATANGAAVSYTPAGGFSAGAHAYSVVFRNNEGTSVTNTGSVYVIGSENFVIEAEDFNYGGGQTKVEASTMPLQSDLYSGLGAVSEVDYHVVGDIQDAGALNYREGESPNVAIGTNGDLNRGSFDLTANYRIGWVDQGEWFNYTRTFPAGRYNVYAEMSKDAGTMGGRLGLVDNPSATTQNVTEVGTFQAPATGAWGPTAFVPLRANDGSLVSLDLNGTKTVRFTSDFGSGDIDHLLFVSTGGTNTDAPRITIAKAANGLTITWTGGGTLQATSALGAGAQWVDVSSTGSTTVPVDQKQRFFRVRR